MTVTRRCWSGGDSADTANGKTAEERVGLYDITICCTRKESETAAAANTWLAK